MSKVFRFKSYGIKVRYPDFKDGGHLLKGWEESLWCSVKMIVPLTTNTFTFFGPCAFETAHNWVLEIIPLEDWINKKVVIEFNPQWKVYEKTWGYASTLQQQRYWPLSW